MAFQELKAAINENGGSIFTMLAALVAGVWGFWRVLPVVNSNLTNAAKGNTIQNELLTTLRQERDSALNQLEKLRDKYEALFRDWAEIKASLTALQEKAESLQASLVEANDLIANLQGHVSKATEFIDSAPPSITPTEGKTS
jgi:chromosome segregation ATPase